MRKVFVVMIAVVLMLGASGCNGNPAAHGEPSLTDIANAFSKTTAINKFNSYLNSVHLPDDVALEDAKEHTGEYSWPYGLTDEEEKAAWELIEIRNKKAEVIGVD